NTIWDVSMTPLNYLLANQSFSLQIGSPNKKARYQFTGRSELPKQFPKKLLQSERQECTTHFWNSKISPVKSLSQAEKLKHLPQNVVKPYRKGLKPECPILTQTHIIFIIL
ncbi:MAG: hypothetical protein ABI986_13245, partial [Chloroflexota bacterium]